MTSRLGACASARAPSWQIAQYVLYKVAPSCAEERAASVRMLSETTRQVRKFVMMAGPSRLFVESIQYLDARLGQGLGPEFQEKIGRAFANDA